MATRVEDAERMIAAARASNRRLFVVSQYRFVPAYRIASTTAPLLSVKRARFEYVMTPEAAGLAGESWKSTPALSGGGILFGSGIHLVDLLVSWFGEPLETTSRLESDPERPGIETAYEARWSGARGEAVEIASRVEQGSRHETTLELQFASRRARIVNWRVDRAASPLSWKVHELALGAREKLVPARRDPLGRQFADILRALRSGERAAVEGEEGLAALRTVIAIRNAAVDSSARRGNDPAR